MNSKVAEVLNCKQSDKDSDSVTSEVVEYIGHQFKKVAEVLNCK
jgi:hypothetical protein